MVELRSAGDCRNLRWFSVAVLLSVGICGGCRGSIANSDESEEPSAETLDRQEASKQEQTKQGPEVTVDCDVQATFSRNGCTTSGCHGASYQGGVDLLSSGVEGRLSGVASTTADCGGRLLIDPEDPDKSLLLHVLDPDLGQNATGDTCTTMMPPVGARMSESDRECVRDWVHAVAEAYQPLVEPQPDFEPVSAQSYVGKVKTLLVGAAPTEEEVAAVVSDPAQLRSWVAAWVQTEAFERKLWDFLSLYLQQNFSGSTINMQQFDGIKVRTYQNQLKRVITESFLRTAVDLVLRDQPFTEIVTTRRWAVTTANLMLLRYQDQTPTEKQQVHTLVRRESDATMLPSGKADPAAAAQDHVWLVPELQSPVDSCQVNRAQNLLGILFGFMNRRSVGVQRGDCGSDTVRRFVSQYLDPDTDFNDWRFVEFAPTDSDEDLVPYYDLATLRAATRVNTRLPRVGFMTTTGFFQNWLTNPDNDFRVTINQTLLVSLGIGFASGEPTTPLREEGLAAEHAAPGTPCYGCHRQLDPLRLYFAKSYDSDYQLRAAALETTPSFAFRGVTHDGGDLYALAGAIAGHPRFASAWTQALCRYANSQACDERDPEFVRVAAAFAASGFNFRTLVVELFSSPLVTGATFVDTYQHQEPLVSITRRGHLCALLDQRLGSDGVCATNALKKVIGLVPADSYTRGALEPTQPSVTSAFHFAGAEAVCMALATEFIGSGQRRFSTDDPDAAIAEMVGGLMGLAEAHSRHQHVLNVLKEHFQNALNEGSGSESAKRETALRSTFVSACLSPEVMALGI